MTSEHNTSHIQMSATASLSRPEMQSSDQTASFTTIIVQTATHSRHNSTATYSDRSHRLYNTRKQMQQDTLTGSKKFTTRLFRVSAVVRYATAQKYHDNQEVHCCKQQDSRRTDPAKRIIRRLFHLDGTVSSAFSRLPERSKSQTSLRKFP